MQASNLTPNNLETTLLELDLSDDTPSARVGFALYLLNPDTIDIQQQLRNKALKRLLDPPDFTFCNSLFHRLSPGEREWFASQILDNNLDLSAEARIALSSATLAVSSQSEKAEVAEYLIRELEQGAFTIEEDIVQGVLFTILNSFVSNDILVLQNMFCMFICIGALDTQSGLRLPDLHVPELQSQPPTASTSTTVIHQVVQQQQYQIYRHVHNRTP